MAELQENSSQSMNQAGSSEPTSSYSTTSEPCRLLALPAELRNYVWALSFTALGHPDDNVDEVDLTCSTIGPKRDLLLSCRQIHSEASSFYTKALPSWFNHTHFFLKGRNNSVGCTREDIYALDDALLREIKHLTVRGRGYGWTYHNGSWSCDCAPWFPDPEVDEKHNELPCSASTIYIERDFNECLRALSSDVDIDLYELRHGKADEVSWSRFLRLKELATDEDVRLAEDVLGWQPLTKREIVGMLEWYRH